MLYPAELRARRTIRFMAYSLQQLQFVLQPNQGVLISDGGGELLTNEREILLCRRSPLARIQCLDRLRP